MKVVTIEVSITDHPDYEVLDGLYSNIDSAIKEVKKRIQQELDDYGYDESDIMPEIICKQVGDNQFKLNYHNSLNDWYVTERNVIEG